MMKFVFFSIITALVLYNWTLFIPKWFARRTGDIEDILMSQGYPIETHNVKTEDGYILSLHRIPLGRNDHSIEEIHKRPPVLLMHGLACSSVDWIIKGPGKAMALLLADAGYDVWLGNNRGNTFSRHHVTLRPDINTKQFFDYSYHEIGIYDLPAMIDYVLNRTEYKQLTYIGFSEGFTSFVVMGSLRPEYNEKILLMNAFAPVTNTHNISHLIFNTLARNPKLLEIPCEWDKFYIGETLRPLKTRIKEHQTYIKKGDFETKHALYIHSYRRINNYHEIGIYDLPAMIDYVLNRTEYKQLTYIGFSEGFTSFVVMGSLRPEYNEKILLMNAFAPVTNTHNISHLIFNTLARNPKLLEIAHHLGWYEMITHEKMSPVLRLLCTIRPICRAMFKIVGLSDDRLYNQEFLISILSNFPAGISLKQISHYIQGTRTGTYRPYDYGTKKNIEIYGKPEPSPYDLTKVTAPIILYYGEDDIYINNDVLLNSVAKTLPNVIKVFRVPEPHFDHMDFLWGIDGKALTEEALQNIDKYNKNIEKNSDITQSE